MIHHRLLQTIPSHGHFNGCEASVWCHLVALSTALADGHSGDATGDRFILWQAIPSRCVASAAQWVALSRLRRPHDARAPAPAHVNLVLFWRTEGVGGCRGQHHDGAHQIVVSVLHAVACSFHPQETRMRRRHPNSGQFSLPLALGSAAPHPARAQTRRPTARTHTRSRLPPW